jgi:hypothetical protein
MEKFVIGVALVTLVVMPVVADPTPTQTPAQLEASANASADAQMPSQETKAAAQQSGKAQVEANKAASNNNPSGGISTDLELQQKTQAGKTRTAANEAGSDRENFQNGKTSAGPVTDQQLEEKAMVDNGLNDGGAAAQTVTP